MAKCKPVMLKHSEIDALLQALEPKGRHSRRLAAAIDKLQQAWNTPAPERVKS